MKTQLQEMARRNGHLAKIKARRVAAILKLYKTDPLGNRWLRNQATHLAKNVDYHLRQAAHYGRVIDSLDKVGVRQQALIEKGVPLL